MVMSDKVKPTYRMWLWPLLYLNLRHILKDNFAITGMYNYSFGYCKYKVFNFRIYRMYRIQLRQKGQRRVC